MVLHFVSVSHLFPLPCEAMQHMGNAMVPGMMPSMMRPGYGRAQSSRSLGADPLEELLNSDPEESGSALALPKKNYNVVV